MVGNHTQRLKPLLQRMESESDRFTTVRQSRASARSDSETHRVLYGRDSIEPALHGPHVPFKEETPENISFLSVFPESLCILKELIKYF